jgi:glycerol-3-phosphate dehydrogenase
VDTIFYTWAGVRALVLERSRSGMTESQVSRKDKIHDHASEGLHGLVTVLGGKITAYRSIAEQLGAYAVRMLNKGGPSRTANEPYPNRPAQRTGAGTLVARNEEVQQTLVATHGAAAQAVLQLGRDTPALAHRVVPHEPELLAQIAYAARAEMAETLADALLRRPASAFRARQGLDGLQAAAQVMAAEKNWDAARIESEIAAYRREIEPMRRFSTV